MMGGSLVSISINLSDESVKLAGKVRAELMKKRDIIEIRDLLMGTIAVANGFPVKTNSLKHFTKISGLKIIAEP